MTDFDYKKYSLDQLSNWMHDAMSSGEATPQEIYDVIAGVVKENYYTYKHKTSEAYELLALLNGNGKGHIKEYDDCVDKVLSCDKDDPSPECKGAWSDFWENVDFDVKEDLEKNGYEWSPCPSKEISSIYVSEDGDIYPTRDKVVKWQLPVELDGPSGEYYVMFPDDLLEAANLKEGDSIEWVDNNDGSYTLRKVGEC